MRRRTSLTFALLIAAQAAHSIEEFVGRLYEVFPPARFVSDLVSTEARRGFLLVNIAICALGVASWLWVRAGAAGARGVIWIWIAVETLNGVGHPLWSVLRGGYTPGVATAPNLLALAIILAVPLSTAASSQP